MRLSWSPRWLILRSQDTTTTCLLQGSRRLASTLPRALTRTRGIIHLDRADPRDLLKAKALPKVRIVSLL